MKKYFTMLAVGLLLMSCGGNDKSEERTPEQIEADNNIKRLEELMQRNNEIGEELIDAHDHIIRMKRISDDSDVSETEKLIEELEKEQAEISKEIDNM